MTSTQASTSSVGVAAKPKSSLGYLPGLDGLRAIAVIGVLLYHAEVPWMPGGFLGVDVFFVLSGFLISSLILVELKGSDRLDYKKFYTRRVKRLLPALLAVLAFTGLLGAFVARDAAGQLLRDIPPALFYVLNWSYVFNEQSYFAAMGRPPMLQHLWSLAVEEQFYIFWPTIMLIAWRIGRTRAVLIVATVGAVASAALMGFMAVRGQMPNPNDASRAYFGTDTHASGVLIGAALAMIFQPGKIRKNVAPGARWTIDLLGIAALTAVLWTFVRVDEFSEPLYRGGFFALGLVTAVLVASASHPGGRIGAVLGRQPMRWVGERSYGIYLWHWPIFVVLRPGMDIAMEGLSALLLRFGLVLVVAELSYRYLEMPIRKGALGRLWSKWRSGGYESRKPLILGVAVAAGILTVVTTVSLVTAPAPGAWADGTNLAETADPDALPPGASLDPNDPSASMEPSADPSPDPDSSSKTDAAVSKRVKAYGDSVILGAFPAIKRQFPKASVNAAVSRQIWAVQAALKRDRKKNDGLVIIHTGNNGILNDYAVRQLLNQTKNARRVVVINQSMPRRWEAPNNKTWARLVKEYPNVRLVDWHAASRGKRNYFGPDQVHMNWTGAKVYAKLIEKAAKGP